MNLRILFIAIAFIGANNLTTFAQKKDTKLQYKKKADEEFELFKFRSAANLYLMSDTSSLEVVERLGHTYKAVKNYADAEHWLRKQTTFPNQPDKLLIEFAEALANNGKYFEAAKWYKKYLAKHPEDRRSKNLSALDQDISSLHRDSVNWKLSYPTFNTSKDEFSPMYFNRGIIFTSNRDQKWGIKNTFGWTETPFTDLYVLEDTASIKYFKPADYFNDVTLFATEKVKAQHLPKTINDNRVLGDVSYPRTLAILDLKRDSTAVKLLSSLNTNYHDGPISFSANQRTFFYNRNHVKTSNAEGGKKLGVFKLNMYSGNYVGGKWYDIEPFIYNSTEYSTAHPALSPDGNVLYFVSDMPGGIGGKDLYYCLREGKSWSKPINLGPLVNTEGDETFPYVDANGVLYFSSTGHLGLGGLDIFKVELNNQVPVSEPKNLGFPINSTKDDFGIIVSTSRVSGFFSSNRYGSDDIFKFDYKPVQVALKGKVTTEYEAGTKMAVPNAVVYLQVGNSVDSTYTNNIGEFAFRLSTNQTYSVSASKPTFTSGKPAEVSTKNVFESTTFNRDLQLMPPALQPVNDDCIQFAEAIKIENIFYDLDKYFIRPDAIPAMNNLLKIMRLYPQITLMVKSHTDSRASSAYNEKLSNNRAKAVVDWLAERGISRDRMKAEYFGKRKLVNGCGDGVDCSEDIHQLNRRSEFYLFVDNKNITINCK